MPTQGAWNLIIRVYWTTLINMCQVVDKHNSKRKITARYCLKEKHTENFPMYSLPRQCKKGLKYSPREALLSD